MFFSIILLLTAHVYNIVQFQQAQIWWLFTVQRKDIHIFIKILFFLFYIKNKYKKISTKLKILI